jgi:ATP-binding cassette subfamily B protein
VPDDSPNRLIAPPPHAAAPGSAPLAREDVPPPRTPLPFIWHYVRGWFLPHVMLMVGLMAASTGIETAQSYILGQLVNVLAEPGAAAALGSPLFWFTALAATWVFGYLFGHGYGTFTSYTVMALRVRMIDGLFGYLHGHAPRYFLDHASGALAQKVRNAAGSSGVIIDYLCTNIVRLGVMFAVTVALILNQAPDLLWTFGLFLVLFITVAAVMAQRLRGYAKASAKASADQVARIVDAISNWDVVRSFARTAFERLTLKPYSVAEFDALVKLRLVAMGMRIVLHFLSVAFLGWLAWTAFVATRDGAMSVGTFTMVVTLSMLVAGNIRALGDSLFVYFEHYGTLSEALSTILAPHEIVDPPDAVPLRVAGGGVQMRNVTFSYGDGTVVFDNFSLSIKPGERIGLVGPSGAGKSTLVKLLRRQFVFQAGQILVDGQDINHVTWDSLHEAFGEVPQNPSMFHRTVRDNIRYSRPDADDDAVVAAAKQAHCHEFISVRAKGYDSIVGEKGMKLSGGERQRVAIARAFLKNAPILILDEATSSLDSEAEHLIQDGLLTLMKGRTVIAIAHRLSTIMHLDRIVVLEDGHIAEQGTHTELLARGGTYARLWNRQAGGFM